MKEKCNRKYVILFLIVMIATLGRLWLAYELPLWRTYMPHDETLLLNYAQNIIKGNWLGDYNNVTLTKGITFSIFLVISCVTRIPYTILLVLYHIVAILIFIYAIKGLIKNPWVLLCIYVFLLYSPGMMSFSITQRIYRNALVMPTVLLILGTFIGIYLRTDKDKKIHIIWAIIGGISLIGFWNLREDSIWIIPFCIVASTISIIRVCVLYKSDEIKIKLKKCFIIIVPFIIFFSGNSIISYINYQVYGIFTLNDRGDTAFAEVSSKILRIEYEDKTEIDENRVWVSRDKYEYIIDHSETLSSIKSSLLEAYDAWSVSTNGNCPGDIYIWAIRDGAQWAGQYESAVSAETFWKKVNQELEEEIEQKHLKEKKAIYFSFSLRGLTVDEIPQFFTDIIRSIKYMVDYESANVRAQKSEGTWAELREIEAFTGSYLIYPDEIGGVADSYNIIATYSVLMGNLIISIYQLISPMLTVISVLTGIGLVIVAIRNRTNTRLWNECLILLSLILSLFVLMAGVTWFTNYLGATPDWVYYYSTGAIPLIQIFQILSIYFGVKAAIIEKKWRKKNG